MGQREIDNMLLSMIQKHFPALPLSDEYTDWGKWLGFARAAYEAGRASPASASVTAPDYRIADRGFRWDAETRQHIPQLLIEFAPVPANDPNDSKGWKDRDSLAAMLAAAPTPTVSEGRKDAESTLEFICALEVRLIELAGELPSQNLMHKLSSLRQRVTDRKWELLRKAPAMQEDKP